MEENVKKKQVNIEDMQEHSRVIANQGILNEGVCTTAAATQAKAVTLGTTFRLVDKAKIVVTFQNGIDVDSPTLAVTYTNNGQQTTAAKPIYYRGAAVKAGLVEAGSVLVLKYNGTQWDIIGSVISETGEYQDLTAGNIVGEFSDEAQFAYRPTAGAVDIESGKADKGAKLESIKGETVKWNQLALNNDTYVDMGLPSGTLWAKSNIDVTQPTGFAASPFQYEATFFSWGNIVGQNPENTSSFANTWGTGNDTEPYVSSAGAALTGNIAPNSGNDASRENNKTSWKMPTSEEFVELFENIDYVQTDGTTVTDSATSDKRVTVNGVVGLYLKSKINGNLLFFACSGYGDGTSWYDRGSLGSYWSASFVSSRYARYLRFYSGGVYPQFNYYRFYGFAIRPVINSGISTGKYDHKYLSNNNNIFDTTLIYGEGNEPSTVAEFEADYQKWFGKPLGYEAYDEGSLKPVMMTSLKTTGYNQYNGNTIEVIGGFEYQITGTYTSIDIDGNAVTPDANGKFTPSISGTLTVTGGSDDTCVHFVHSGTRDGEFEPYWTSILNVPVTSLTGKLNGEGSSVVVFPDGMKKAGTAYDEIVRVGNVTKAIKRVGSVDLGTLTWYIETSREMFTVKSEDIDVKRGSYLWSFNCRCGIYDTDGSSFRDKVVAILQSHLLICNTDYSSTQDFKTAMSGVIAYYELAEPEEYILDDFELPQEYDVDDYGTEEILLGNGVAPTLDIKYGINAADTIKNLPHNYVSAVGEQNFTEAQKARARKNIGIKDDEEIESKEVTAESIASLFAEVQGLKAQLNNLGETKAVCINSEEVPKVQNYPMIVYGSGAPATPNVPAFIGQKYLDTTNKKEYTAFSVTNSISDWVLVN